VRLADCLFVARVLCLSKLDLSTRVCIAAVWDAQQYIQRIYNFVVFFLANKTFHDGVINFWLINQRVKKREKCNRKKKRAKEINIWVHKHTFFALSIESIMCACSFEHHSSQEENIKRSLRNRLGLFVQLEAIY
jgi:hypothetical protein